MRPHQPTPTPHMKGDNRRQRETRPLSEPKKPTTPTNTHPPHEGRQPETTGDKTTSEPKKPTTPTNTKAARSKVALRTPTVNCLGKKMSCHHLWNDPYGSQFGNFIQTKKPWGMFFNFVRMWIILIFIGHHCNKFLRKVPEGVSSLIIAWHPR